MSVAVRSKCEQKCTTSLDESYISLKVKSESEWEGFTSLIAGIELTFNC